MTETRRQKWTGVCLLSGLALALSLWGGTPFEQLDSLIPRAKMAMENGGDPGFFHYPALVIYLTAIPYSILDWMLGDEGVAELTRASRRNFDAPFFSYYFPGHLLSAGFGLLGVLSVRAAALTLFRDSKVAFAAGAILATSLLWISDTHMLTVDVPLAALLILTAERTLRVLCREAPLSVRAAVIPGLCAGLATAAKYNGALILVPLTIALVLHARRYGGRILVALFVPGAVAVATFLLSNPYVLLDFEAFRTDFLFEWKHSSMGHAGYIVENGYAYHLFSSLGSGLGWPGLIAAAVGVVLLLRTRSVPTSAKVLLIGFPLLHYALIGNSKLAFARYMLPMLPFLALAASAVIRQLGTRLNRRGIASLATIIAVVAPGLMWGIKHDRLLAKPDIRRELVLALAKADLDLGGEPVYAFGHSGLCARWAKLPFRRKNLIATPNIGLNATRLYIFDSFSQERVLYENPGPELEQYYPGNENVQLFENYASLSVVQVSPFNVPKADVPLSRKSLYSPFLPDLRVRERAGPFFELCFTQADDADRFETACRELGIKVVRTTGTGGWYFNRLRELAEKRQAPN